MRRALDLAAHGLGRVEPNPMVGCVLVRNRRVIGEGFHQRFGGPHAEVEALRACRGSPRGATAYVTLEPCCYHGKTPPCTDTLLAAGVGRVYAAMRDPNPRVSGAGIDQLRKAGVAVEVGLCAGPAAMLNAPFIKLMQQRRPWVILKWAQSLDGRIATRTGDSKWISDDAMRAHAHALRARVDAIIVGVRTALRDDPALTCRLADPLRIATRIVLDPDLRLPATSQLVATAREFPTRVYHAMPAPGAAARPIASAARKLRASGVVVRDLPRTGSDSRATRAARGDARVRRPADPGVSLPHLLDDLGADSMTNVMIEGGGRLLGRFLDERLADEIQIYIAPLLIGGRRAVGALDGAGARTVVEAVRLSTSHRADGAPHATVKPVGSGWVFQGRLWEP